MVLAFRPTRMEFPLFVLPGAADFFPLTSGPENSEKQTPRSPTGVPCMVKLHRARSDFISKTLTVVTVMAGCAVSFVEFFPQHRSEKPSAQNSQGAINGLFS